MYKKQDLVEGRGRDWCGPGLGHVVGFCECGGEP